MLSRVPGHVRYQFESLCRKVIHSERCDCLRCLLRYMEHEISFSALPKARLGGIGYVESRPEGSFALILAIPPSAGHFPVANS